MSNLELNFGAMADTLVIQLAACGLRVSREKVEHFQRDADAITRLSVRGLLPDSQAKVSRQRLIRRIAGEVEQP